MPDSNSVDAYVRAVDEANDYTTSQIDGIYQQALEDIDELFINVENRESDIWEAHNADPELTIDEFEDVENSDRDLDWGIGLAAMSAAALVQFTVDNADDLIFKPIAYREQLLDGFSLAPSELVSAGRRGTVGALSADVTEFKAIQARYLDDLSVISRLDPAELYRTLREYEALQSADVLTQNAMGYVSRMTSYRPGSPQWKEEVAKLVDRNSSRALKGMTRRSVERIHTLREVESTGEADPLLVWIGEGGANTCQFCLDRFGVIQRYSEWIRDGLPGADVCKGGDLCKCGLTAA